jgi:hypothetical protein
MNYCEQIKRLQISFSHAVSGTALLHVIVAGAAPNIDGFTNVTDEVGID